ncbi:MAG: T9SS type A sorting domain-containing protein [Crocinitomicaceae bacterium]
MKKFILLYSFLLISILSSAQNIYSLTANDFGYTPDTLYIEAGDTVELINNGYHSITEVDSIDWVNNNANYNGGFYVGVGAPSTSNKFTINSVGTYYNICVPHAGMGMKSIIIVEPSTLGFNNEISSLMQFFYPNPASSTLTIQNTSNIKIFDSAGRVVFEKNNIGKMEVIDISYLTKGVYFVMLDEIGQKLIVE